MLSNCAFSVYFVIVAFDCPLTYRQFMHVRHVTVHTVYRFADKTVNSYINRYTEGDVVPVHVPMACSRSRGIAPPFPNVDDRQGWP